MTLPLASTTMSPPPPDFRSSLTTCAGSALTMRELAQAASVRVVENTTFSTASSHCAKARSRGSAASSLATAGQNPPKPW
jgi:hypothetical protein